MKPMRIAEAARIFALTFLAITAAEASTFHDGDLYLVTNGYQSFGPAVARIDPATGQDSLVVDLPWNIRAVLSYCPYRDRLLTSTPATLGGLSFVDADGNWSQPFPSLGTPYGIAARGDGIVYLFQLGDTFRYLDAQDGIHDLMDSTGTAPFQLGATGIWDELFYDPSTNSLFVANGDNSGYAACADGTQSCFVKLPLSADGTRVVGEPVSVQEDISSGTFEDDVVGSGLGPGGTLAFTVDTNSNNREPRMQLLDPVGMTLSTFASNGFFVGAAATCAGTYSSVRGQWVIRDYLNNVLRAFSPGEVGNGTVISNLGPGFTGSLTRLVEIVRGDSSATAVAPVDARRLLELQVAPNPFGGATTVSYDVPDAGSARLTVHDVTGRLIRTLGEGTPLFGRQVSTWNGRDDRGRRVPAGVYFVRLRSTEGTLTRRMVRLR
ncbi:MAG TPA: T9SS type A sorting domain-containing protein [bacterium]|nr:T9SS type A sorting domain-containing protein [bacterium]